MISLKYLSLFHLQFVPSCSLMLVKEFHLTMFLFISTPEIIVVSVIVVMLFGAKKIPEIARGLGQTLNHVKNATSEIKKEISDSVEEISSKEEFKSISKEIKEIKKDVEEPVKSIKQGMKF